MESQQPKNNEQKLEGLPIKDSPYTQYKDLEDYKEKGYGTHGHQEVKPGRGAMASTDAPTSGVSVDAPTSKTGGAVAVAAATQSEEASDPATITDTINQHGVC
uniref:uncharacterized protein LOC122610118 n=1 Tax=Erigeron canadensis TaxID=72917 RepID=UPI001CB8CB9B|nr:uncharacterized protein LOC122610118 [Erigeron canadensis]